MNINTKDIMKLLKLLMLAALFSLFGCGGGVDTDQPIGEVQKEAETMTVADLKAKASDYQELISRKMSELEPLKAKLSEIPLTEQMGDEAKALQADLAALSEDLGALKDRLNVYLDALKAKGESVQEYLN